MKIIATNRKARHNYHILETFEAGLELRGNEVKSLRTKTPSLNESFGRIEGNELFLYNMHIPEFALSSYFKTDPKRVRKLLVHRKEIKKLIGFTAQGSRTLIPLKVYFTDRGVVKVEMALAKGKRAYDKRKKLKERIAQRETERTLKRFYKKRF